MGLDQFWLVDKGEDNVEKFAYHRKVPQLNQYMLELYSKKEQSQILESGGFNIELDMQKVLTLMNAVLKGDLDMDADGFFWGRALEQHNREILESCVQAILHLTDGNKVIYAANW